MTKEQLAAIRERCEAATPGPWLHAVYMSKDYGVYSEITNKEVCATHEKSGKEEQDARFIAHAREDIPALLEALEEAEARCKPCKFVEIINSDDSGQFGRCPGCEGLVFLGRVDYLHGKNCHCCNCGQRLEWGRL